ncbi:MAG: ACP S-malonyltransferase [Alphaproteobacteria bacterium]|nr:ACP S-malonyltransferase [Alphaproteobacteria bacterium]
MTKTAFLFPGQGSQAVGMGHDLAQAFPIAKKVFDDVDAAIGNITLADGTSQPLSHIIFNGPADTLTLTEHTQPALMAVSMAVLRVVEESTGKPITALCQAVAGHSLGEYSALCAINGLTITQTAQLLQQRGRAMQAAVPNGVGAMAALLGMNWDEVKTIIDSAIAAGAVVACANDNADGQVVISGTKEGVEAAITLAKNKGLKRAVPLPVSAPFHSPLMQPAALVMQQALAKVTMPSPLLPVYNNVTARAQINSAHIKNDLVSQVCGRVRFRETILNMVADGFTDFVEIGAGKVLQGLVKRIAPNANCFSIGTSADVKERLDFFKNGS